MHLRYFICGITALFLTFLCTGVRAQTTQLLQDFEGLASDDLPFTTSEALTGSGASPTFNVVTSVGTFIPTPSSGSMFFGIRNTEGAAYTITFDAGEVCNLTSAAFAVDYFAFGLDGADDVSYELMIDGFSQASGSIIEGENSNNGGPISSGGWQTFTQSIPGTAQTASLIITVNQVGASDAVGIDNVRLTATGTGGSCNNTCGISINDQNIFFNCDALTAGDDGVTATIPYTGAELNAVVTASGGTVSGDHPSAVADGDIVLSGLIEGQTYTLTVNGGDCNFMVDVNPPAGQCAEGLVLINEFLASPSAKEFVEVVSLSDMPLDVTGYTIADRTNNPQPFPAVTLATGEGIVLFLGAAANAPTSGCTVQMVPATTLNDSGDDIVIRNAAGQVVAQHTYVGADVVSGESQARMPDRDPAGTFALHGTVAPDGGTSSPCFENQNPAIALPLTLRSFTARANAKTVRLAWETASEVANDRFEIERGRDGSTWVNIGVVAAVTAGRATGHVYNFTDRNPTEGRNYYRLRQVDLDGTAALYGPVSAEMTGATFGIYPNPAGARLRFTTPLNDGDRASILSADGRLIREVTNTSGSVNVAALTSGIYLLRVTQKSGAEVIRFVKR